MVRPASVTAIVLLAAGLTAPGTAVALAGDTSGPIGIDGSVRSTPLFVDNGNLARLPSYLAPEEDHTTYLSNTIRLVAGGRQGGVLARYEFHLIQTFDYASDGAGLVDGSSFLSDRTALRYRAVDLTSDWMDEGEWTGALSIDRLWTRISTGRADLAIGRQPITFGKAYFWNPLDIFGPFDPRRFDRDYKPGVDAARLDLSFGSFSGLTVVGAAGDTLTADREGEAWSGSWYGSALVGRLYATAFGFDGAVQGGKVYGGRQFGGAVTGEIAGIEVRAEGAWFEANEGESLPWPLEGPMLENHGAFVAGVGRYFTSTLLLEAEYLYHGLADPDDRYASLARVGAGHLFHSSRHVAGAMASYEILPIVIGSFATIVSLSDGSFQIQPGIVWSTGDDSEIVAGALLSFGDAPEGAGLDPGIRSEFGTYPDMIYAQFKRYF